MDQRAIFENRSRRGGKPTATSITKSQRSTCNVVFYHWDDPEISKLKQVNITSLEDLSLTSGNVTSRNLTVIRNDVIRCNITKNKGSSSGNFSIVLKRGKIVRRQVVTEKDINYLDVIHPGDWVMIYIKKSGNDKINVASTAKRDGLKMLGIVENVRYIEVDDPNKGSPRLEYIITGRDFGKVFENTMYFNPILSTDSIRTILGVKFLVDSQDSLKGLKNRKQLKDLNPKKVIKELAKFYLGGLRSRNDAANDPTNNILSTTNQIWYTPKEMARLFKPKAQGKSGGISFIDILNLDRVGLHRYNKEGTFLKADDLPGIAIIKSLSPRGTIWSALEFLQNSLVNEMFTELTPDKEGNLQPSLILRQVPFSNDVNQETSPFFLNKGSKIIERPKTGDKTFFTTLTRTTIKSSDIRQKNIGKSDFERINHIVVVPRIDTKIFDILFTSLVNVPSIQRYGLKSFQGQTAYVLDSDAGIKNSCEFYLHLMVDWFFLAHHLFNGTIIIDGVDDHVELGSNLFIADINQLFHIEGYTHTYEINPKTGATTYNTEFRVSRGQVFRNNIESKFIGPSTRGSDEPTTISTSVLEGIRNG